MAASITVIFEPADHDRRNTKRCRAEEWREHFEKHVFNVDLNKKNNIVHGFIWSHNTNQGGQLKYLEQSSKDLGRDCVRMVQLLKTGGFMTERSESHLYCRPALKRPNRVLIWMWRTRHALEDFFLRPMEKIGLRKRAFPKQDRPSADAKRVAGEKTSSKDMRPVDGLCESGGKASSSSTATSDAVCRRQGRTGQQLSNTRQVSNVSTDGVQPTGFHGDHEDHGQVITVSNSRTDVRNGTWPNEPKLHKKPDEVPQQGPSPHVQHHWRCEGTSNRVVIQGCNINRFYIGGRQVM
jgi:hypothetical protein